MMSAKKLSAAAGAISAVASSLLFVSIPAASATSCTGQQPSVQIVEWHSQGYAAVGGNILANPCRFGVEAIIEGPTGTPQSIGNDATNPGTSSITAFIP